MKIKFLIVCLIFVGCRSTKTSMEPLEMVRCLRTTLLPDADPGGWWRVISRPVNSMPLTFPVKNSPGADNPCVNLAMYGCGQYQFRYYVESNTCSGCIDSTGIITINYTKKLAVTITCN